MTASKRKGCGHENTSYKYDCDGLPDPLELEYLECLDCGAWLPIGESNDTIAGNEFSLAEDIADLCILWEPGDERERRIESILDVHLSLYGIATHQPMPPDGEQDGGVE